MHCSHLFEIDETFQIYNVNRRLPSFCTIWLKEHGVELGTRLRTPSKCESERKKVELLI